MIILKIQVEAFSFGRVDPESNSPIASDGKAPAPLAVEIKRPAWFFIHGLEGIETFNKSRDAGSRTSYRGGGKE